MNIGIISLGCAKNLVDSEIMLHLIQETGYHLTDDLETADVIIINTCAFIEDAKQESIQAILDAAEYKKGRCQKLIVTGCLSQRYRDEMAEQLPEVDAVIGTGHYGEIVDIIRDGISREDTTFRNELIKDVDYLNLRRTVSTGSTFAYLKIAEGCDNRCTYCIIPSLRGNYISRKKEDILKEAKELITGGIKEIVLIAQDITYYGIDIYHRLALSDLLREICALEGDFSIRLMYCYPERFTDALIDVIAANEKIMKYIDLPIQHISDNILKGMGRKGNSLMIKMLIKKLRSRIPGIVLRTSLIVGFPGESEADFAQLKAFVEEVRFERLGVFTYSREEGTPAAKMKGQIKKHIKQYRKDTLMQVQKNITEERNRTMCDCLLQVVVESVADDGIFYTGRSYAEAPDGIDPVIYFTSPEPLEEGMRVNVKILTYQAYDLIGEAQVEM